MRRLNDTGRDWSGTDVTARLADCLVCTLMLADAHWWQKKKRKSKTFRSSVDTNGSAHFLKLSLSWGSKPHEQVCASVSSKKAPCKSTKIPSSLQQTHDKNRKSRPVKFTSF